MTFKTSQHSTLSLHGAVAKTRGDNAAFTQKVYIQEKKCQSMAFAIRLAIQLSNKMWYYCDIELYVSRYMSAVPVFYFFGIDWRSLD